MRVDVVCTVAAPRELVWEVLTSWERQPEWMLDAKAVEVLTPQREGEGVTIRCPTRLLGATVQDVMRVTRWDPPGHLEVTHLGRVITGSGAFELRAVTGGTEVRWWEEIRPPLGRLGQVGARALVRPVVSRIFSRSLARLAGLAEQAAADRNGP